MNICCRSRERVDLTFFDAHKNGSNIDLGDIPFPIQTNISGHVTTSIGVIQNGSDVLSTLPISRTIVNITEGDTSYIKLTNWQLSDANGTIIDAEHLGQVEALNGTSAILINGTEFNNLKNDEESKNQTSNLL